jgi:hypothetical protein
MILSVYSFRMAIHEKGSFANIEGQQLQPGYKYTLLIHPSKIEAEANLEEIDIRMRECLMPKEKIHSHEVIGCL